MNGNEMLDIMGKIDPKLVNQAQKRPIIRWVALAACLALVIGIGAMLLRPGESPVPTNPVLQSPNTNPSANPTEPSTPAEPTIPNLDHTVYPEKITGIQHLGSLSFPTNEPVEPPEPQFHYQLIVEAKVTSILPTLYQDPLNGMTYHILQLETLDVINGNNIPSSFYLRLPSDMSPDLQGFDSLIISMEQQGIEDYLLINTEQKTFEAFSLLFECETYPYCFDIVPFKDGLFDSSIFTLQGWQIGDYYFEQILSGRFLKYQYPAMDGYTPADTKAHIKNWIDIRSDADYYRSLTVYTRETFAQSEVFDHVQTGIFAHARPSNPIYCRIINGFPTTEQIIIQDGTVTYDGEAFTQENLQAMPDIGAFIEGLDLDSLAPPHIEDTSNLELHSCGARGMYAKVDGQVYGLVRIIWAYFDNSTETKNDICYDGLYYLATADGTIRPIERDDLLALLGENPCVYSGTKWSHFIESFEYGTNNSTDPSEENPLSDYLTEEDGRTYLILPISKEKVRIEDRHKAYIDLIDINLLWEAEQSIYDQTSKYSSDPALYLHTEGAHLYLSAEVIIDIAPPESGMGGCGIDHEHLFFSEIITKEPLVQPEVYSFSFAEDWAQYPEGTPGVKHSGFKNTTFSHVIYGADAIAQAEREVTIDWNTTKVYYDSETKYWMVLFYTKEYPGGCQSIYMDWSGKTLLIVSGE